MNAGVSIRPCPVLSRPERAFVLLSVALTSNIGRTLEMIAQPASSESYRLRTDSLWRLFYWTLLALVFAGAIWQRFRLPLDPIADPDIWGYLSPALRKLTGAEFGHTNGRNFIYPGFVFLVLRLFADFRAITIAHIFSGFWPVQLSYLPGSVRAFSCRIRGSAALLTIRWDWLGPRSFSCSGRRLFSRKRSARRHLRLCPQHHFLSANPISCLFFSGAPAHGHGCICDCACLYRNLSRFDQTKFWSGFAFCIVANHCLVLAEWLVVAKGLVFSRVRLWRRRPFVAGILSQSQ